MVVGGGAEEYRGRKTQKTYQGRWEAGGGGIGGGVRGGGGISLIVKTIQGLSGVRQSAS